MERTGEQNSKAEEKRKKGCELEARETKNAMQREGERERKACEEKQRVRDSFRKGAVEKVLDRSEPRREERKRRAVQSECEGIEKEKERGRRELESKRRKERERFRRTNLISGSVL